MLIINGCGTHWKPGRTGRWKLNRNTWRGGNRLYLVCGAVYLDEWPLVTVVDKGSAGKGWIEI